MSRPGTSKLKKLGCQRSEVMAEINSSSAAQWRARVEIEVEVEDEDGPRRAATGHRPRALLHPRRHRHLCLSDLDLRLARRGCWRRYKEFRSITKQLGRTLGESWTCDADTVVSCVRCNHDCILTVPLASRSVHSRQSPFGRAKFHLIVVDIVVSPRVVLQQTPTPTRKSREGKINAAGKDSEHERTCAQVSGDHRCAGMKEGGERGTENFVCVPSVF